MRTYLATAHLKENVVRGEVQERDRHLHLEQCACLEARKGDLHALILHENSRLQICLLAERFLLVRICGDKNLDKGRVVVDAGGVTLGLSLFLLLLCEVKLVE